MFVGEVCQEGLDDAVGGGGHVDGVRGEQSLDLEAVHDGDDGVGRVVEIQVGACLAEFRRFCQRGDDLGTQVRVAVTKVLL